MRRRVVLGLSFAGLVVGCATPGLGGQADRAPSRAASCLFEYGASDGEFTLSVTLDTDGRWREQGHADERSGQIDAAQRRKFVQALDAAPFESLPSECEGTRRSWGTIRDCRDDRRVEISTWRTEDGEPCDAGTDPKTRALLGLFRELSEG